MDNMVKDMRYAHIISSLYIIIKMTIEQLLTIYTTLTK